MERTESVTRRAFLGGVVAGTVLGATAKAEGPSEIRPNILWITCEDMSPHLGCYGDPEAHTPNLDRLAAEGVRHTAAFSVSGVCAPSRSCLITGMYPTTLGTCHMRCNHAPPDSMRCFPAYLRTAGYYCTNNVKTDYQFDLPPDAWDENSKTAHWRNRPRADQPFFAVFNFTITHESQIGNLEALPSDLAARIAEYRHDPARANFPPYYPDTPLIRRHWAHYYDLISAMDGQAGDILRQLDEDGLRENTLVFFFSDHGTGLPRAKRWMYDAGLHVPLIIRWPGQLPAGEVSSRLVSFVDFVPTVLSAARVQIPNHMQGTHFLGKIKGPERSVVFAARDRMDERYDLIRAARDKRFKYVRNYEPLKPYDQYLSYPESFPVMQEMRRVQAEGGLNESQALFFRGRKPVEELYDTETDPHELNNRIDDPTLGLVLKVLRSSLDRWIKDTRDIGFVPEPELEKWLPSSDRPSAPAARPTYDAGPGGSDAVFGQPLEHWVQRLNGEEALDRVHAMAALAAASVPSTPVLIAALDDPEPCVAYWAAIGIGNGGDARPELVERLSASLQHGSPTVRLGAARALCMLGHPDLAVPAALAAMAETHFATRLLAVEILASLEEKPEPVVDALKSALQDPNQYVVRIARRGLGLPPER